MTPEQAATLKHFKWEEFNNPDLVDYAFMSYVDDVRQEYGFPIVLTSDARTKAQNDAASGSSPKSRHLVGQAVDFQFPPTSNHLWLLVAAIYKCRRALPVELEIVHNLRPDGDSHIHLAWLPQGKASSLIVALD